MGNISDNLQIDSWDILHHYCGLNQKIFQFNNLYNHQDIWYVSYPGIWKGRKSLDLRL